MILKRVGPLSVGKNLGVLYAFMGALIGCLFAVIGLLSASFAQGGASLPGAGLGLLAIIIFPLIYGGIGFVGGTIMAALYNVVAGMVGGIELELQQQQT